MSIPKLIPQNDEQKTSTTTIDEQRGFTEEELQSCIKVLNSFKRDDRISTLNDRIYKPLRTASQVLISGVTSKWFNGKTPEEFNQEKRKRAEKKKRKAQELQEEDRKRLDQSDMRKKKIQKLEQLCTENANRTGFFLEDPNHFERTILKDDEPKESQKEADSMNGLLNYGSSCYICKSMFYEIHHFYDRLCPSCSAFNFEKRTQKTDLSGKIAIVTGARVKIGYHTGLILLRNGCFVIATSRFPRDTAMRYSQEEDFHLWKDNLVVYGLDLRFIKDVESFCDHIISKYKRLDILIHNAAQTIRRPPSFYSHLIKLETLPSSELPTEIRDVVQDFSQTSLDSLKIEAIESNKEELPLVSQIHPAKSALLSQIVILPEDSDENSSLHFPSEVYDEDNQQIDLRDKNSWVLEHESVSTVELVESQTINSTAPFVMNSKFFSLMKNSPTDDKFIINVSSVEGLFYHHKSTRHPHTNMAKASLNMMTRTSSPHFAKYSIWMNSVDTGWINDMNPVSRSTNIAKKNREKFRTPLDYVDAACRIVDPIFITLNGGPKSYGKMLKDYQSSPW